MVSASVMVERRRASRVLIRIPIRLMATAGDGRPLNARAEAVAVSRYGALLRAQIAAAPALGSRIEVMNGNNQEIQEFRVIRVGETREMGVLELGVEMLYPGASFWGIHFPDEPRVA